MATGCMIPTDTYSRSYHQKKRRSTTRQQKQQRITMRGTATPTPTDVVNEIETLPLRSYYSNYQYGGNAVGMQASSRSVSDQEEERSETNRTSNTKYNATSRRPVASEMARQAVVAMALGLLGWYGPRHFISIQSEQDVAYEEIPYQTTAAGDVILDFSLNQPLVDPATIPCTCIFNVWLVDSRFLTCVCVCVCVRVYMLSYRL
jgi:hypothetical protein